MEKERNLINLISKKNKQEKCKIKLHASFKNQDDMTYYYYRDIILKQQKRRQTTKQNFAIISMVNFMNLKFRYIYIYIIW
jgi:superfamily II DNA helicase RecQ